MQRLAFATVALFATIASANAQIVTKYSGIQPIEHPPATQRSILQKKSAF
jgi:hypothetical protein